MSDQRLKGKVAMITGGASGIGLATVELFIAQGAHVLVADLQDGAGAELSVRFGKMLRYVHCDVSREDQVRETIAVARREFGRLDILFNNAGVSGVPASIQDMSVEGWDAAQAVLLRGPMLGIKHAAPVMRAGGGGTIINTASIAGLRAGVSTPAYAVAKAGLIHLSRMAALELAPFNIRVNTICPGVIMTPLVAVSMGAKKDGAAAALERVREAARTVQPIGRSGDPRDIAEMCLFLASDAASFVSGQEFVVDGALLQKGPDGFSANVERIMAAARG